MQGDSVSRTGIKGDVAIVLSSHICLTDGSCLKSYSSFRVGNLPGFQGQWVSVDLDKVERVLTWSITQNLEQLPTVWILLHIIGNLSTNR